MRSESESIHHRNSRDLPGKGYEMDYEKLWEDAFMAAIGGAASEGYGQGRTFAAGVVDAAILIADAAVDQVRARIETAGSVDLASVMAEAMVTITDREMMSDD